jgi:hypothetical protein
MTTSAISAVTAALPPPPAAPRSFRVTRVHHVYGPG